jgi:hypothetical protein
MRRNSIAAFRMLFALLLGTAARHAVAEDAYFDVRVGDLNIVEGTLPEATDQWNWRMGSLERCFEPRIVLEGDGEAYPSPASAQGDSPDTRAWRDSASAIAREFNRFGHVALRAPVGKEVSGRLYVAKPDLSGMVALRFTLPAAAAKAEAKTAFLRAKTAHYTRLLDSGVPGGAWFRHERAATARELVAAGANIAGLTSDGVPRRGRIPDGEDIYELFSGGRAVSENLQLDRVVSTPSDAGAVEKNSVVDVASIEGITVREMDWKPLVRDLKPKLDPLAAIIPADQHVLFLPSFAAATRLADEATRQGVPILRLMEPRAEDAQTLDRYQRQLGITLSGAARLVGSQMIDSLALTGSDPYFRTGTDIAVLMEAKDSATLAKLLVAQVKTAAQGVAGAKSIGGDMQGVSYAGMRSPDRAVCSYVAVVGNSVVVTNSPTQLRRVVSVYKGATPSIASLPEYTFFRNRYALGDKRETALLFLSDATIRRWCGPRWRIGSARRTLAAAVIADQQADSLDALARQKVGRTKPLPAVVSTVDLGQLQLTSAGVTSSAFGSLAFATPIVELSLDNVTQAESAAYSRWRDSYQRNWQQFFDPIAVRFEIQDKRLAADLTVMPLILGTDYRDFVSVVQKVKLAAGSGDPHDALGHFVIAIDTKSPPIRQASQFALAIAPGLNVDPLGWLGKSIAIYADDSPFWDELAKVKEQERGMYLANHASQLPVAIQFEVTNGLKLTAFLTALRAFVEQTAPGMTHWENAAHKDLAYVKVVPTDQAGNFGLAEKPAVYYYASGDALVVSSNEAMLKRAIDRQIARREAKAKGQEPPAVAHPWQGESVALHLDRKLLALLGAAEDFIGGNYQSKMQASAWGNLPILNEWKRRFPDLDPLLVYARFAQANLVCPGDGKYIWNDKWQTMESTVYGHPGEPKEGPPLPPVLDSIRSADLGLTFEQNGLRAKAALERTKPTK